MIIERRVSSAQIHLATEVNGQPMPIYADVKGAPFFIGQRVTVHRLVDETVNKSFLLRSGIVHYFDYDCGCGQSYPEDPMIGVHFPNGDIEEFWREELKPLTP